MINFCYLYVFVFIARIAYCEETLGLALVDGTQCLDGSPAGYYIAMSNSSSDKWVIYHEGGGWCTSLEDCYARSTTLLGSTLNRPQQIQAESLTAEFSDNPNLNMLMHDWNKVLIVYCDGGSFTGNNVTKYKDKNLYFRGRQNLEAIKDSLLSKGLSKATDVVISGCSAGGLAVYLHLDWWKNALSTNTKVTGLAIDGYFLDRNDVYGFYGISDYMRWILTQMNSSTNDMCMQQNTQDEGKCMFPESVSNYITTPFFIFNSKFNYHTILGTGTRIEEFGSMIASSINVSINVANQTRGCFVDTCVHHCTRDNPYIKSGPSCLHEGPSNNSYCIGGRNSTYAFKLFYEKLYSAYNSTENFTGSKIISDTYIDEKSSVCLFCCGTDKVLLALIISPVIVCVLCIIGVVVLVVRERNRIKNSSIYVSLKKEIRKQ